MQLDVGPVLYSQGGRLSFAEKYDFSDMEFGAQKPADSPVEATGEVVNTAGVLLLKAGIETVLHCVCDRCAAPFERDVRFDTEAVLCEDPDEEDVSSFPITDGVVDLDEIITSAFVLQMDSRFICKPDCKGLCPRCGADLNSGPCGCESETDPRWEALRGMFGTEEQ